MVMEHINKKLSQCLPDVDINTQIICLSTTKAFTAQKYGVMNSEFASLTDRIGCLVSKSITTRLYIGKMYMKDDLCLSSVSCLTPLKASGVVLWGRVCLRANRVVGRKLKLRHADILQLLRNYELLKIC